MGEQEETPKSFSEFFGIKDIAPVKAVDLLALGLIMGRAYSTVKSLALIADQEEYVEMIRGAVMQIVGNKLPSGQVFSKEAADILVDFFGGPIIQRALFNFACKP